MSKDRQLKQQEALARQSASDALNVEEKIKKAQSRYGASAKELDKLNKLKEGK